VAIDVLRGLGRQSHRETVLTIARLLQTYLGVDVGLPEGPPLAANSKARPVAQAALPALKQTAPPPLTKPTEQGSSAGTWQRRSNPG
jgi:hypothetical protein